jgi:hypothetical protein
MVLTCTVRVGQALGTGLKRLESFLNVGRQQPLSKTKRRRFSYCTYRQSSSAIIQNETNGDLYCFGATTDLSLRMMKCRYRYILPAYLFDVSGGSGIVGQFSGRVIGGDAVNSNEFATLDRSRGGQYWQLNPMPSPLQIVMMLLVRLLQQVHCKAWWNNY